jgi:adenosylcobinamide-phosphate synthase
MAEIGTTVCIAFVLDLLFGDPRYTAHPVRLIGSAIRQIENLLRRLGWIGREGGILLAVVTCGCMLVCYLSVQWFFSWVHPTLSLLFDLFLVYSFLALGDLLHHIKPVANALERRELDAARQSLAMTVGRDVRSLDREGIARAAIETLAENFVDGFLSPVFWYFAGGILFLLLGGNPMRGAAGCMLLFKCASTLDSMVGYKNERYILFGWAGARLDDLMNLVPARLSLFFLWVGALLTDLKSSQGIRIALRDRLKHDSPNSAHPESFVAGALDIRLGGPSLYPEGVKVKPWLGDGESVVNESHVRKAMALVLSSAWSAMACPILFTAVHWVQRWFIQDS